jgi:CDP-diacylglycerol--glycerol-3-phosphate 3-phosphatidyltransferase
MPTLLPTRLPANVGDRLGRTVARTGITPNMVSAIGFGGAAIAAWLISQEKLVVGGIVFLIASLLDLVDGAVARATGKASPYGAVFDAVLDRSGEAIVLTGIAWYFGRNDDELGVVLAFTALFGSVAVSYIRARAEIEGMEMREGLFRRQERVAVLSIGLLFGLLMYAVGAIAVLANLTALQRSWTVARHLRMVDEGSHR